MAEYQPAFSPTDEDRTVGTTVPSIPPQILARWAAIASERAYLGAIPRQASV